MLPLVKIHRYSTCIHTHTHIYIHTQKNTHEFLCKINFSCAMIIETRQVISKNRRDESRCIFTIHSVRVPLRESITLLFPSYKKSVLQGTSSSVPYVTTSSLAIFRQRLRHIPWTGSVNSEIRIFFETNKWKSRMKRTENEIVGWNR